MTRNTAAALLSLSLLVFAGPAAAQDAQAATTAGRTFEALYTVHARGFDVGDFNYSFTQTGDAYQISARRQVTGLFRSALGKTQDFTYSVEGAVGPGGTVRPTRYTHRGGKRDRVVSVDFTGPIPVTTASQRQSEGHPPVTPDQKRGTIDQLSAIASVIVTQSDPCNRTIKVLMEGRSRFDFVMTPAGQVNVSTDAYRGQALRCRVEFRPIGGFSDPQDPATLTFLFAPTNTGMFAPIRIEMPSDDAGLVRLEARRVSLNGTRLR